MADVLINMPAIQAEDDMLRHELLLAEDGPLTIRYCPFDWVNPIAKVVIVGITPGLHQMFLSCQAAQRALIEGKSVEEALEDANTTGSFAGPMRSNLIAMLDAIGLQDRLGLQTTGSLFGLEAELLHSTSAVLYPAFLTGKNYGGSPGPAGFPLLRSFVDQVLTAELAMVPNAVIIPLGKAVAEILQREADRGAISAENVLFDFPHPSGGNGHRVRQFQQHQEAMAVQIAGWSFN